MLLCLFYLNKYNEKRFDENVRIKYKLLISIYRPKKSTKFASIMRCLLSWGALPYKERE